MSPILRDQAGNGNGLPILGRAAGEPEAKSSLAESRAMVLSLLHSLKISFESLE